MLDFNSLQFDTDNALMPASTYVIYPLIKSIEVIVYSLKLTAILTVLANLTFEGMFHFVSTSGGRYSWDMTRIRSWDSHLKP
jgi:hypothetical protein